MNISFLATQPAKWLTVDKAAKLLKLTPTRVRQLLANGRLQGCRLVVGGRERWHVHSSLTRRPGKPGRPAKKTRRQAVHGCVGKAAA